MMKQIIPITDLRDTNEILTACKNSKEPIYVTKNGYCQLVIMSLENYEKNFSSQYNFLEEKPINIPLIEEQDQPLGFIKVCALNIDGKINDVTYNSQEIIKMIKKAYQEGNKIIVLPELVLTSYSCGDMFLSTSLNQKAIEGILKISSETKEIDAFYTFGAPIMKNNVLYNCAICMHQGKILAVVPKKNIPNYNEFYEKRYFKGYDEDNSTVQIGNYIYPFGNKIIFKNSRYLNQAIGVEICEDMWVNIPQSALLSQNGATIICNLSSSNETLDKSETRLNLIESTTSRSKVGYIYSSSSLSESSSDVIFSGHNIIYEPGYLLKESSLFDSSMISSEIDIDKIISLRRKQQFKSQENYKIIYFSSSLDKPSLTRRYNKYPFIPSNQQEACQNSLKAHLMQAKALIRRLKQINCKDVVIGVSGGLDSTLALLACVKAFDLMNLQRKNIHAITMPCFGTTNRTKDNATKMCENLGVDLICVDITKSVKQHLKDIKVSLSDRSTTFENAQARERTQILMDYSNKLNAIVIGTGDLSEIALGWSTYNGDHMSMYNLNCSIPKTLVKKMTFDLANEYLEIKDILLDILDTPISPELLPPSKNEISQITEDKIGPYQLHDFFLYHLIYMNMSVDKLLYISLETFKDDYSEDVIKKWLNNFIKRFFNNQFKRSCSPDGPKITQVSLSPRGDFRLPSDISGYDFLNQIK